MAYSTPSTLSSGNALTATHMNLLRTNEEALAKPPVVSAYKTANQLIVTGGFYTTVQWQATDTNRSFTLAANVLTAGESGLYLVLVCFAWDSNATGARKGAIIHNGTWVRQDHYVSTSTDWNRQNFSVMVFLDTDDQLTIGAHQSSGTALNLQSGPIDATQVQVHMLSRI